MKFSVLVRQKRDILEQILSKNIKKALNEDTVYTPANPSFTK